MGTIAENLNLWDKAYEWKNEGDEWSEWWGNSRAQWTGSLFPRIDPFVPCDIILEIGPGHGRWTQYLKSYCRKLQIVDLSPTCVEACRNRFGENSGVEYYVNDGKSLDMIEERSIDLAFSFDSLVHVEADVIRGYLGSLATKLSTNGVGFFHHSNLADYRDYFELCRKIPEPIRNILIEKHFIDHHHYRGASVSAEVFEKACLEVGLVCLSQELIGWDSTRLIDCLSTFTSKDSKWCGSSQVRPNRHFMLEAKLIKARASQLPDLGPVLPTAETSNAIS